MSADIFLRRVPHDDADAPNLDDPAPLEAAAEGYAGRAARPRRSLLGCREAVGLRRDLSQPFAAPSAGVPLNLIEIDGRELADLLAETGERANATAAMACRQRRLLARRQIGRCFVALASGARPCFVQFLLDHSDNQALRRTFGDIFPHLLRGEALLEGAFVPATFSAERIMPAAMARVAGTCEGAGIRYVHAFVPVNNPLRLRAAIAAGFAIHQWRRQRGLPWRRTTSFGPVPDDFNLRL
jgi:hypothetical protein